MQLIDVDVLLEQMEKLYQKRSEESNMTGDRTVCVTWNDAVFCIKDSPAVDAVPVVRCRECVYWASGANEDESWEYCYWFESEIDGNEFCSYGERKGGAEL